MITMIQWKKKISGRESQEIWRQEELIGGQPLVVN
jgi:hypothetical protein